MRKRKHVSKLLVLLIALAMVLSTLPQMAFADESGLTGEGTAESPYLISSAEGLKVFRDKVNSGEKSACAKLTADINLGGEEWTPIVGTSQYAFAELYNGSFDGDGHKIKGLSINSSQSCQGLFGKVNNATIKNLQVEGTVNSSNNYVGGIVGDAPIATIENCSFNGTVTCSKKGGYAGGICGQAGQTKGQECNITRCSNRGTISATGVNGNAGGIAGIIKYGKTSDSYNAGSISAKDRGAGIAGSVNNYCKVLNCYNIGEIEETGRFADIAGYLPAMGHLENCWYTKKLANFPDSENPPEDANVCYKITSPEALLAGLGKEYTKDANNINKGYPILKWEAGVAPAPLEPKIEITGVGEMVKENNSTIPQTILTVNYIDIESGSEPHINWTLKEEGNVVELAAPENPDPKNHILIVKGINPGKATVVATSTDGTYTAEKEVFVYPVVTTVEIEGTLAVGETVKARVNVLGGAEYDYETFPDLKFQWKYLTAEDYQAGHTGYSDYKPIAGAKNREFIITDDLAGNYLSVTVDYKGENKSPNSPVKVKSANMTILEKDKEALTLDTTEIREAKTLELSTSGTNGSTIAWASSADDIINPNTGAVTLPKETTTEVTLTATLSHGGERLTKTFTITVVSDKQIQDEINDKVLKLKKDLGELGEWYKLYPKHGTDTNVNQMVKADLEKKGITDIEIKVTDVEEVHGGAGISKEEAQNGQITYFYKDPNGTEPLWFGSYQVTFQAERDGVNTKMENVPVIIYWDRTKVKEVMTSEILDKVTKETIKGKNNDLDTVMEDLVLPKVVDGKKWTLISWKSSNPNVISVSDKNQKTADTLFEPYVGIVRPGAKEEKVTLTAIYNFQRINNPIGEEEPLTLNEVYEVTVKPIAEDQAELIQKRLQSKLDAGFAKAGMKDAVTGQPLEKEGDTYIAPNDIQLPTTRDFEIDGKYYPVVTTSNAPELLAVSGVNNSASVEVIRPAVGKDAGEGEVTVSIFDKTTSVSASKTFKVKVPALTQEEIDKELALMEKVKGEYFNGIKGKNTDKNGIDKDLKPFMEVSLADNGDLKWVYDHKSLTGKGIEPTPMEGWQDLELWRLFKSSNAKVISHENLLVTRQIENKRVKLSSALSSKTLGKYGKLYKEDPAKYSAYASLAPLYYQPVEESLIVKGLNPSQAEPVEVKINASFTLKGKDGNWIEKTEVKDLDEGSTAFDVFKKVLGDNDYNYDAKGSYIYKITRPDGTSLGEFDEGQKSGWMYRVNGILPNDYLSGYVLKDNDDINFYYTKNYIKEPGVGNWLPLPTPEENQVVTEQKPGTNRNTTTVIAHTTANEDVAKAVVSPENQAELLKQAEKNNSEEIIFHIPSEETKGKKQVQLELTTDFLKKIVDRTKATVTVDSSMGKLSLDRGDLEKAAAEGKPLMITIDKDSAVAKAGEKVIKEKKAAAEKSAVEKIKTGVEKTSLQAKSVKTKNGIKITWTKSKGYRVDYYEVYRSVKRYKGYGKTPIFTTKNSKNPKKCWYVNTKSLKEGTKYYYKVRGVRMIDGEKVYTEDSTKVWRTF